MIATLKETPKIVILIFSLMILVWILLEWIYVQTLNAEMRKFTSPQVDVFIDENDTITCIYDKTIVKECILTVRNDSMDMYLDFWPIQCGGWPIAKCEIVG